MTPALKRDLTKDNAAFNQMTARAVFVKPLAATFGAIPYSVGANLDPAAANAPSLGVGSAFIGGSCCVHLSIEYVPSIPTVTSIVAVIVDDSEGTVMAWGKQEKAGAGYQIKEGIITTKPGAELNVLVVNMTARVRWCEIFSC